MEKLQAQNLSIVGIIGFVLDKIALLIEKKAQPIRK